MIAAEAGSRGRIVTAGRTGSRRRTDTVSAWLFLAPFLAVYATLLVFPFLKNIWISLFDWNLLEVAFDPEAKIFVGLKNYVRTLWGRAIGWAPTLTSWPLIAALLAAVGLGWGARRGWWDRTTALLLGIVAALVAVLAGLAPAEGGRWFDPSFWTALRNTVVFVMLTVPAVTAIALMLAVCLNRQSTLMATLRAVFYLPSVLSVTVITLIWSFMYSPAQGLIANVMRPLGLAPLTWTTSPDLAMPAIVIATVWWVIGFPMIVLLAGLQDIPKERLEAGRIDGAGTWGLFRHITLPGIRRPLMFVVLYETLSQFQIFGQAHLITEGGPGEATQTLVRYLYLTGFRDNELGRAAAMAFILFLLMAVISFLYLRLSTRRIEE